MHLAISGLDLLNVHGSAPELKQSSHTWQQKEAKFVYFVYLHYRQQRDTPLTGEVIELR